MIHAPLSMAIFSVSHDLDLMTDAGTAGAQLTTDRQRETTESDRSPGCEAVDCDRSTLSFYTLQAHPRGGGDKRAGISEKSDR